MPLQSESFILRLIDDEPEHRALYFCLGLINFRAKRDLRAAREDFRRFIEHADPSRHARQIQAAQEWISEIDAEVGDRVLMGTP